MTLKFSRHYAVFADMHTWSRDQRYSGLFRTAVGYQKLIFKIGAWVKAVFLVVYFLECSSGTQGEAWEAAPRSWPPRETAISLCNSFFFPKDLVYAPVGLISLLNHWNALYNGRRNLPLSWDGQYLDRKPMCKCTLAVSVPVWGLCELTAGSGTVLLCAWSVSVPSVGTKSKREGAALPKEAVPRWQELLTRLGGIQV